MYDSLLCLQSYHMIADMESRDDSFTELYSTPKTSASQCKFIYVLLPTAYMFFSDVDEYKKFMNLNCRFWVWVILEVKSAAFAGRKKFLKISSLKGTRTLTSAMRVLSV